MSPELSAEFEKHFPGGPLIQAKLQVPTDRFSITVLFGPSGSGKTTVLRCLAGLDRPSRGHIHFEEETWFDAAQAIFLSPQRRGIGYVSQEYALFPHLTVCRNIAFGLGAIDAPVGLGRFGEPLAQTIVGRRAAARSLGQGLGAPAPLASSGRTLVGAGCAHSRASAAPTSTAPGGAGRAGIAGDARPGRSSRTGR